MLTMPEPVSSGTDGHYYFALRHVKGARSVRMTFGIRRSYFVEFLAKPVEGATPSRR
jgi:hypothetical protein